MSAIALALQGAAPAPAVQIAGWTALPIHGHPAPRGPAASRPGLPRSIGSGWLDTITRDIERSEYRFSPEGDGAWSAPNRAHDLRITALAGGIGLTSRAGGESAWRLGLRLESAGRGSRSAPLPAPRRVGSPGRIEFLFEEAGITEWYLNDASGLEQGYTILHAPVRRGDGDPLVLRMALTGNLRGEVGRDGRSLLWRGADGGPVLNYGGLAVRDSGGRELPAWLHLGAGRLEIRIDDRRADYPIEVDPLMTSPRWTGSGSQIRELYGISVAGAGDVDRDGYDDIIVGAYGFDGGFFNQGRAYVYMGSPDGPSTAPGWIGTIGQMSANFGFSVSGAGDVNGDGYGDVIVGAFYYSNTPDFEGGAFVYLGSSSGLRSSPSSVVESNEAFSQFATTVASAGDVDGDGYDDVIVGAPYFDVQNKEVGAAWVYSGSASGQLSTGRRIDYSPFRLFGSIVSGAGDVNGDGYDDVITGAYDQENGVGYAFVFSGAANGIGRTPSWVHSEGGRVGFGFSSSGAGDVNGDGYADIIVGDGTNLGGSYVYHGSPTGPGPLRWTGPGLGGINTFVSSAGDVNGDGYGDVIVGEYNYSGGQTEEGRIFVYLGSITGLAPSPAWAAESNIAGARMGITVDAAGDVNGDGLDDVIAGAPAANGETGMAFVYLGGSTTELIDPACASDTVCNGEHLERVLGEVRLKSADDLIDATVVRTGVTTDGVSLLLLRKATDAPVTYSLVDIDGTPLGPEWGVLSRTDGSLPGSSVTVPYETTARGTYGFALYRPPSTFPGGETSVGTGVPLTIRGVSSGRTEDISLRLFPPPVILVHGLWSGPGAWTAPDGGLEGFLRSRGYDICTLCRIDYGTQQPAPEFDPLAPAPARQYAIKMLAGAAADSRFQRRLRGVATTQADVVAHSLGGLVARARTVFPGQPYRTKANYLQGEFHKLITLGTPHSGSPLARWLVGHKCERLRLGDQPFSIDTYFAWFHRPIAEGVYSLQPSSAALWNIGRTDIKAFTLAAIEPGVTSETEIALNLIPLLTGHPLTTIDSILGGEGAHDTIVPLASQQGGIGRSIVRNGIVHADMSVSGGDTGETESEQLWSDVLNLLQATPDVFASPLPPPIPSSEPPIPPVTCALASPAPPSPATATVSLTPPPGTPVAPGEDVAITFSIDGGNPVDGALFLVDDRLLNLEGQGPFSFSYRVPGDRAGIIEIRADTYGPGPANYTATSYLVIGRPIAPDSIAAVPAALTLSQIGDLFQIRLTGHYPDGSTIDLTSPGAGTTYALQSGNNLVASVSPTGLVEARGAGTDVVLARNSSLTAAASVTVEITNRPPAVEPIAPVTILAGEALDLPIAGSDPDGDAVVVTGLSLPAFATVADLGNGSGRLRLRPGVNDVGVHALGIAVSDDGAPPLGAGIAVQVTVSACPVPAGSPGLSLSASGLSWSALADATSYDVVRGDLASLAGSRGDFSAATQQCLAQATTETSLPEMSLPVTGQGTWFLVRGSGCGGHGTFDSGGTGQAAPRDAGINASAAACP